MLELGFQYTRSYIIQESNYKCMECCWLWETKTLLLVLFSVGIKKTTKQFSKKCVLAIFKADTKDNLLLTSVLRKAYMGETC